MHNFSLDTPVVAWQALNVAIDFIVGWVSSPVWAGCPPHKSQADALF
ncbi:hypothetical protein GNE10_25530 [Nostoc sp. 2RC]|nr:hypothetical protein [Nostoc sp. 2RC]